MRLPLLENVKIEGELGFRLAKNFARLEDREYRPEVLFEIEKNGWAGDWEGRTILALVLLSRITGKKAAYLEAILDKLETEKNSRGYLKEVLPPGQADEQQLSGHNWLLRGLLEHYLWTGSERSRKMAEEIVENLYLPIASLYAHYPTDPALRSKGGNASGCIEGKMVGGWRLSTDIGCAFMPMDALSQYYAIFGDSRVADMLFGMLEVFRGIDFLKASMQTHASLSACRGVLRLYECSGKKELLDFVIEFFAFYKAYGMTENYANYNWFGRPFWTEPCAVVDSYLVAMELWKITKDSEYLQAAHRIYENGLGHGQRKNGGFGCDDCAGPEPAGAFLCAQEKNFEAFWCCTMRGAEGLTRAAQYSVLAEEENVYLAGCFDGEYCIEGVRLHVSSKLPYEGSVRLNVKECEGRRTYYLYVPQGAEKEGAILNVRGQRTPVVWKNGFVVVSMTGCGEIFLAYKIALEKRGRESKQIQEAIFGYWHGDLMLGIVSKERVAIDETKLALQKSATYSDGMHILEPVGQSIYFEREELLTRRMQVLFSDFAGLQDVG